MKKILLLLIALIALSGYATAHGILSSTTVDAIGTFGSSTDITLISPPIWHLSDLTPPSPNILDYHQDRLSKGIVPILYDSDYVSTSKKLILPSGDSPSETGTDPRFIEFNPNSGSVNGISDFTQMPGLERESTNIDDFRLSDNPIFRT